MKYDFTSLMNRSGHDSIAVDQIPIPGAEVKEGFSRIPMWVADMNFRLFRPFRKQFTRESTNRILATLICRMHIFDSIIRWQKERNGVEDLPREAIGYENGVLGCCFGRCRFSIPGRIHSSFLTYISFTGVLENCGRNIVLSDLVQDERTAYGIWTTPIWTAS